MSELKVYHCNEWHNEYTEFYMKSEADNVIADLEHQLQAANEQVENLINSASSIMLSQDKVNDNKCKEIAELKDRIHKLENMPHTDNSAVIELLENQNAELREATRWRKCSEQMPEDGSDVLATDGEEIWLCYKTTMPDGLPWFQPNGQPHIEGVTHWMPLPSAPNEVK